MRTKRKIIKEQEAIIAQLKSDIAQKDSLIEQLTVELDSYHEREQAIACAMTEATATAHKVVAEAQTQADRIISDSELEAEQTRKEAEILVEDAYQNARDIVKEANERSRERLEQTGATIISYGELLNQYNKAVMETAAQAEQSAKRFAEFYQKLQMAVPEMIGEAEHLSELSDQAETHLPDTQGDPAILMQNIYTLEHRSIPTEAKMASELQPQSDSADVVDSILGNIKATENSEVDSEPSGDSPALNIFAEEDKTDCANIISTVKDILPDAGEGDVEIDTLLDELIGLDNNAVIGGGYEKQE